MGGDYVHFVVEYGGKIEKCRVTETDVRSANDHEDIALPRRIAISAVPYWRHGKWSGFTRDN